MRKARTFSVAIAALSIVALALAGCAGSDGNKDSASKSGTTASGSAVSGAAENTSGKGYNAAVGGGIYNASDKTGGTVNAGSTIDCESWDPARTYYAWCWAAQRLMTRTLMAYAGEPGEAKVVPDLAESPGTSNADATVWTYKIRSGIKFSDGTPVTSKDIKYGIERVFATDVITGGPTFVICLLTKCAADGSSPYKGPYKDTKGLDSIETPDDNTIVFHLVSPYADWNYLMTMPDTAPVQQAKDTGDKYGDMPQATGPFVITSYKQNQQIVFERNKYWDQATDPVRKPKADKFIITIYSNPADLAQRLKAGDLDLQTNAAVDQSLQAEVVTNPTLKANTDDPTTGFVWYISVVPSVKPLDNIHCRKAIAYALNKSDLGRARGGTYGGEVANTMTPPGVLGHTDLNMYPVGADNTGDLTKAKDELTQCGQPNGFSVNMTFRSDYARDPDVANAVQQALNRVGIKVNLIGSSGKTYYSSWLGSPKNVEEKKLGLASQGWAADFPTGNGFFYSIAYSKVITDTGNYNTVSLRDPAVDAAIEKGMKTTDPAGAKAAFEELDKAVMDQAVYIPHTYDKALYWRAPRLTNVYCLAGDSNFYDFVNIGTDDGK